MPSILRILSPSTAPYSLITCVAYTATSELMTDAEKVAKIIAAVREYDAMFPSQPITMLLQNYDEREGK